MNGSGRAKARKGCKTQGPPGSKVPGKKSQLGDINLLGKVMSGRGSFLSADSAMGPRVMELQQAVSNWIS